MGYVFLVKKETVGGMSGFGIRQVAISCELIIRFESKNAQPIYLQLSRGQVLLRAGGGAALVRAQAAPPGEPEIWDRRAMPGT